MADLIGRGSGTTVLASHPQGDDAMQTTRRVRHDVADAARLALFSLAVSAGMAVVLILWVRWLVAA